MLHIHIRFTNFNKVFEKKLYTATIFAVPHTYTATPVSMSSVYHAWELNAFSKSTLTVKELLIK